MKKLSILLIVCILVGMLPLSVIAGDVITEDDNVSLVEPITYSPYTTSWGEVLMVDSNGKIADEICVTLDILIDIEDYHNGSNTDFFGVSICSINQLFEDSWVKNIIERVGHVFCYTIKLSNYANMENALRILKSNEHVLCAVQNTMYDIEAEGVEDTSQYDTYTGLTTHYDLIGVSAAWEYGFVGSDDITVAIIDTGVAVHSEYDNNINFALGYNVVNANEPTTDVAPTPGNYHGHGVTGIVGADLGDGGVNGICKNVNIVPIKFQGGIESLQAALVYAIGTIGADIVNISYSIAEYEPYKAITQNDVLIVVSAGNAGMDLAQHSQNQGKKNNADNWIVVGCSTVNDTKQANSNYSSQYVDLFAPGDGVPKVPIGNDYENSFGAMTSFSSPMVAAAAALIMSHAPHLSAADVAKQLINNVDKVSSLSNLCVSGGRLAIDKAILALYEDPDRGAYSKGDINGDEIIDQFDYLMCKSAYMGQTTLTAQQADAADVNNDDAVDMFDYLLIQSYINKTAYFSP